MSAPGDGQAQEAVDGLARQLGAPVLVEEPAERVIAYSAQEGPIDQVRRDCILSRAASPEVVAFFARFDLATAEEPFRTPSQPELGVLGRLCVPIRRGSVSLGYVWLIDDDARLGDEDVGSVQRVAERLALLLHDRAVRANLGSETVGHLLSPTEELRDEAARQLVLAGRWPEAATCAVGVLQLGRPAGGAPGPPELPAEPVGRPAPAVAGVEAAGRRIAEEAERWRRQSSNEGVLAYVDDDHVAVVSPGPPAGAGSGTPERPAPPRLAEDLLRGQLLGLRRQVLGALRRGPTVPPVLVGVGDLRSGISEAARSYRNARRAAEIAGVAPELGGVATWSTLGAYRILAQLRGGSEDSEMCDPRLEALLSAGRPELVETLEAYLDRAGDAKATADHLVLHRGGLYYRLGRIEQITGCDLRDGADRLALHIGLRLARVLGRRVG